MTLLLILCVCGLESKGLGLSQWMDVGRQVRFIDQEIDCQRLRTLIFVAAEQFGSLAWSRRCYLSRLEYTELLTWTLPGSCLLWQLYRLNFRDCSQVEQWHWTAVCLNKQPAVNLWTSLNCWGTQWTLCPESSALPGYSCSSVKVRVKKKLSEGVRF